MPGPPLTVRLNYLITNPTTINYWNHSRCMEDQSMIIGERLRALREEKKFSQGEVESERDCFAATSLGSSTDTQFQLSRPLKNLLAPSKSRWTNSPTTAKNRPNCRTSRSGRLPTTSCGAARARTLACLPSSAGCSAAWKKVTWEWCCSWHRRWRGGRQFEILVVGNKLAAI